MNQDIEIFRGAGALAALEAEAIRALLRWEGIPSRGGRLCVKVSVGDYERARELVSLAMRTGRDVRPKGTGRRGAMTVTAR